MAEQTEQTDWSGGSDISGPVFQWSNQFDFSEGIGFSVPGLLSLQGTPATPVRHGIASGLSLPDAVYPADIDGDGDEDVAAVFWNADAVLWFENANSQGTSWVQHTVDNSQDGPRDICAADFDGDGDLDLLGAIHAGSRLVWWESINNGQSWTYHSIDGYLNSCSTVRAVDMDNDGDLDALASGVNVSGDLVVWWENTDSAATWIEHNITTSPFYPRGIHHADFDGDGDMDVAVAGSNDDEVSWWENPQGQGTTWIKHSVDASVNYPYTVHCADMDGDGDSDIVAGASHGNQILWWDNVDGVGSIWTRHTIDSSTLSPHYVTVADLDNDGDADVLSASYVDNTLAWFESRNGASTWTKHIITNNCPGADMVRLGDLDGNGTLDAVSAAYLDSSVDWFEIIEFVDFGELTSSIFDTSNPAPVWDIWEIDATQPAATQLIVEARTGEQPDDMDPWVELQTGNLGDELNNGLQYLQYRISLSTSDNTQTPSVQSINFNWTTPSATGARPVGLQMFAPYPNPSNSGFRISYELANSSNVELAVYDLAGRLVEVIVAQEQGLGIHRAHWNGAGFAAGVYLLRLSVEGEIFTRQAVICQ